MNKIKLNENLAILAGAHAADGHFSKKGSFQIVDEDKNNLEIILRLIKEEFNLSPKIVKVNNKNEYLIQFQKKEFYSFFKEDLNFPLGPKTYNVRMPTIIKNNLSLEKAFVSGAMTFESSVNINKSISLNVTSKKFRDDVAKVLNKNRINIKLSQQIKKGNRKKQYIIRTSENLKQQEMERWLEYYLQGSEKWFKILELSNGFFGKVNNIEDAKAIFKQTYDKGRNIKVQTLICFVKNLKQTDINYIFKKLKIGKTTIMKYLKILNNAKIITRSKQVKKLNLQHLSKNTHITLKKDFRNYLFAKINQDYGHDAKICRFLNIKDFTYCKWKNGERGLSLDNLNVLLKLSKISKKNLKIEKVDREIISFNNKTIKWRVPWRPWSKKIELDTNNKGVQKWIIKN